MKENISIKGNETIEELVKKVTTVDSIDGKMSVCVMIISYLEIKNKVHPGSYTNLIVINKFGCHDPRKLGLNDFRFEIKLFLFLLHKSDRLFYLKLTDTYEKLQKKEIEENQKKIRFGLIGVVVIILIYFIITNIRF
jgi:hypothetical protein